MLRTFHITGSNKTQTQGAEGKQLNVSECDNGKKVILGIDTGEQYIQIKLNYQQYHELCDLQYTLDLSEDEPEQQEQVESNQPNPTHTEGSIMSRLFNLGQVVITASIDALQKDESSKLNSDDLTRLLYRHQTGDDGDICDEDHESNQVAIKQGYQRVFSVYKFKTLTVWIITEHDRSCTTVLLPEDY